MDTPNGLFPLTRDGARHSLEQACFFLGIEAPSLRFGRDSNPRPPGAPDSRRSWSLRATWVPRYRFGQSIRLLPIKSGCDHTIHPVDTCSAAAQLRAGVPIIGRSTASSTTTPIGTHSSRCAEYRTAAATRQRPKNTSVNWFFIDGYLLGPSFVSVCNVAHTARHVHHVPETATPRMVRPGRAVLRSWRGLRGRSAGGPSADLTIGLQGAQE